MIAVTLPLLPRVCIAWI